MLLSEILSKAHSTEKEIWNLDDGTYTGTIVEFKLVKDNTYVILKIQLDDDMVFMNYSSVARYTLKPLNSIVDPFEDSEDIVGNSIEFDIVNNTSASGKVFSNITSVAYIEG